MIIRDGSRTRMGVNPADFKSAASAVSPPGLPVQLELEAERQFPQFNTELVAWIVDIIRI